MLTLTGLTPPTPSSSLAEWPSPCSSASFSSVWSLDAERHDADLSTWADDAGSWGHLPEDGPQLRNSKAITHWLSFPESGEQAGSSGPCCRRLKPPILDYLQRSQGKAPSDAPAPVLSPAEEGSAALKRRWVHPPVFLLPPSTHQDQPWAAPHQ